MSIRDFSNRPCAVCNKDTMHFVNKCRECGTVQQTNYEGTRTSIRRHFAKMRTSGAYRIKYLNNKKEADNIKMAERLTLPEKAKATQMEEAIFGKGRERSKA